MDDRRAHPRFVSETRVEVRSFDRPERDVFWTTDISTGGVFVATPTPPPLGTRVQVHLQLWEGPIVLSARVVRRVTAEKAATKAPGAALAFTDLSPATQAQLDAYLAEYTGPHHERDLLRQSWVSVFPERVRMSEVLVAKAFELKRQGREQDASRVLEDAVELDPFNRALEQLFRASCATGPRTKC